MNSIKILVTGRNWRIADNVAEHLEVDKGYRVVRCRPQKRDLIQTIQSLEPDIIIICTGNETRNTIEIYNYIMESSYDGWACALVVAGDDDREVFTAATRLKEYSFLSRPVSVIELYSRLSEIEKKHGLGKKAKEEPAPKPAENHLFGLGEPEVTRKRILVVDDDPEQLAQIKEHLREYYDVMLVRSGEAAFSYLAYHKVDLVLLDYVMPQMDGPTVLYRMRTNRALIDLPVAFLTGVSDRERVIKTLVELKPQGYIIKPVKKSEIIAKIIDIIG